MPKQKTKTTQPSLFKNNGQEKHNTKASLSSLIKSSRDIMRKDAGLNGDLDRLPQLSWILFLKCYDDLEIRREEDAKATRQTYKPIIPPPYRWRDWASDEDNGATGEELVKFVNDGLLPTLRGLTGSDERLKVAEVFKETYNRMLSGYLLRDVVNLVDGIHFQSKDEIFTLAHLYESMLKEMRDAAGDSGEFYTPRPVVKLIVDRTKPRLGETVLDPACGTGGFLVEAYEYLKPLAKNSKDQIKLQSETLYGVEKKPLPYLLGTMNLLLHGVENPNIRRDNALKNPLNEIGEKDRFDVIVTNPPFGGEEEAGIQLNFPENTRASETALLFMQFVMRSLKHGGRCGVVVPNGFLFSDGVAARVKAQMLRDFNLHTIIRLPRRVFTPYTPIATNLLFFDRTQPTTDIWFYEHILPEGVKNYAKTRPLRFEEFQPILDWWDNRTENERAWKARAADMIQTNNGGDVISVNLDIKNPSRNDDLEHLPPRELVASLLEKEKQILEMIHGLGISSSGETRNQPWQTSPIKGFLKRIKDSLHLDDDIVYKQVTVRLWNKGATLRGEQLGKEIKTKRQFFVREGQVVISRIDARNGAIGIVSGELDGAIVSNDFWVYECDRSVMIPKFLMLYMSTMEFLGRVDNTSSGTTKRIRAREDEFLSIAIPVPPIEEQLRIVTYLDGLQAKVNALRGLQVKSWEELSALMPSVLDRAFKGEL